MEGIKQKIRNNIPTRGLLVLIAILIIVSTFRALPCLASATDFVFLGEAIKIDICSNMLIITCLTVIITILITNRNKRKLLVFGLILVMFTVIPILANPADPGHVASSISAGTFESGNYVFPNNLSITQNLSVDGSTLWVDSNNNVVGIGTMYPVKRLDVIGDINATGNYCIGNVCRSYWYTYNSTYDAKPSSDTDTNASTACGTDQYLEGDGNCVSVTNCGSGNFLRYDISSNIWTCAADDDQPDSDAEVPNVITVDGGTINLGTNTFSGTLGGDNITDGTIDVGELQSGDYSSKITSGTYSISISGNAATATVLAANGANCEAGQYPLGIDASGAVESCTVDDDNPEAGEVFWSDLYDEADAGLGWSNLTAYPNGCSAGSAVRVIGDTLTCIDVYDATDDAISDCTEVNSCTITAEDVVCTGCVGATDLADGFDECSDCSGTFVDEGQSNSITSGMVAFNYAASGSEGGAASDLACTGCVGATDLADSFDECSDCDSRFLLEDAADIMNDNDGVDDENILTIGDSDDLDNLIVYGEIGIGTANPSDKLHIASTSDTALRIESGASNTPMIKFYQGTNYRWVQYVDGTTLDLKFYSLGSYTDVLTLNHSSGDVGIGTTSPDQKLDVAGDVRLNNDLYFQQPFSGYSGTTAETYIDVTHALLPVMTFNLAENDYSTGIYQFSYDGSAWMTIKGSNVGIGTTDPDHDLEIGTTTYSEIDAGEATFTTGSSREFKENFEYVDEMEILDGMRNLPIKKYNFKKEYALGLLTDEHGHLKKDIDLESDEIKQETNRKYQNLTEKERERVDRIISKKKIGPMAEDFYNAFGLGESDSISGDHLIIVNMLATKALINEVDALKEGKINTQTTGTSENIAMVNETLINTILEQEQRIEELEMRLETLENMIQNINGNVAIQLG